MSYTSLMVLLGTPDILEGFTRKDFLHPTFFIHCYSRLACTTILEQHQNNVLQMDILLPDSSIDLVRTYRSLSCPRKSFYIYCLTEQTLRQFRQMPIWTRYDAIFNMNLLQRKLERTAQIHLTINIDNFETRTDAGDDDAADLLVPIGEILEENARMINEEIREASSLSVPAAEFEQG